MMASQNEYYTYKENYMHEARTLMKLSVDTQCRINIGYTEEMRHF